MQCYISWAVLREIPIDSHKNSTTSENYNIDDVVTGVIRDRFAGIDIFNIKKSEKSL